MHPGPVLFSILGDAFSPAHPPRISAGPYQFRFFGRDQSHFSEEPLYFFPLPRCCVEQGVADVPAYEAPQLHPQFHPGTPMGPIPSVDSGTRIDTAPPPPFPRPGGTERTAGSNTPAGNLPWKSRANDAVHKARIELGDIAGYDAEIRRPGRFDIHAVRDRGGIFDGHDVLMPGKAGNQLRRRERPLENFGAL